MLHFWLDVHSNMKLVSRQHEHCMVVQFESVLMSYLHICSIPSYNIDILPYSRIKDAAILTALDFINEPLNVVGNNDGVLLPLGVCILQI